MRSTPTGRRVLFALVTLPFLTSTLIRSFGWIVVLGPNGPFAWTLDTLTGGHFVPELLYNRAGLIIGMVSIMMPFFVLPLYAVWSKVPPHLDRAARSLGAGRAEAFLSVQLPLTLPGAGAGGIIVFVTSLGFFVTPSLVGGAGDRMVSQVIDERLTNTVDLEGAAVLALMLLLAVLTVLVVFRRIYPLELLFVQDDETLALMGARNKDRSGGRGHDLVRRVRLRVVHGLDRLPWSGLTALVTVASALLLIVPLAVTVLVAFSGDPYLRFPPSSFSTRWFSAVLADPGWRHATGQSLVVGLVAVGICLATGLPAAFVIAHSGLSRRVRSGMILLTSLPVILPPIVLSLGVYAWFLDARLIGVPWALGAAHALLGVPFLIVIVSSALRDFDRTLERAGRSLGATRLVVWRVITIPLIRAAITAGLLFAFLQSFDELLIARGVSVPETETLPVKMWTGSNEQISPALAAASTLLLGITCVVLVLVAIARRSRVRKSAA